MFLEVVSTHTKYIMNDFALVPRTNFLNFKCHTVTNGTDLRKSPLSLTQNVGEGLTGPNSFLPNDNPANAST